MTQPLKHFFVALCIASAAIGSSSHASTNEPIQYVNPLQGSNSIGAFSTGNTYPAVAHPWGTNAWSPQTGKMGSGWLYSYIDKTINGFRVTHQPSPWCNDYGVFALMPVTGEVAFGEEDRASAYSHKQETSRPDYYSVLLERYGIKAELTPSMTGAIFNFTYPKHDQAAIILDCFNRGGEVKILPKENKIIGYSKYYTGNNNRKLPENFAIYFVITSSKPFKQFGTWNDSVQHNNVAQQSGKHVGGYIRFATNEGEKVELKVAASFVSAEQAQVNFDRELAKYSFAQVQQQAASEWNKQLEKIEVKGGTLDQKRTLYTALYRTLLFPRRFSEIDKSGKEVHYSPYTGKIEEGPMYADNGFWDTFRATHPFNTILFPELSNRMMQGLVHHVKEGGWVPEWFSPGTIDCMIGQNSASVIADAYLKGIRDYDYETLWEATIKGANNTGPNATGRSGVTYYNDLGYVPYDLERMRGSVSKTMEYAYNDWCIAQWGKSMGKSSELIDLHLKRAHNYANVFDTSLNFVRARDRAGEWEPNFSPDNWNAPFTEGSSWHWTWAVFHDPQGLINLMGGDEKFVERMDEMFEAHPTVGLGGRRNLIHEMTEMIAGGFGQYAHGNQPVQHAIYLYNYAGAPYKAQYWARQVMDRLYHSGWENGKGLCGDEDNGQTSTWYIMSALGFYSVCPGSLEYPIGSPLFDEMTLNLPNGKKFTVKTINNGEKNYYIQSAKLNGVPFERTFLTHSDIMNGGTVEYVMGATPNTSWGTQPSARPSSMTKR